MEESLKDADFETKVIQAVGPILIDFHADWCGPCKVLAPILEDIVKERQNLTVFKVNVDQEPELARKHQVMSIPTLVLYQQGKIIARWMGLRSKMHLLKEIDEAVIKV